MPPHIAVCLKSMAKACESPQINFHLTNPENIGTYLDDGILHPNYLQLTQPALRADCIRAALLATHGGWWWDADTIAMQSPMALMAEHPYASALYMTWTKPPLRVLNGYIYMKAGYGTASRWLAQINEALAHSPSGIEWCSLGEKLLTDILPHCPHAHAIPRRLFLPIDIDSSVKTFFDPHDPCLLVQNDTVCFGLNHSWFMYHKPHQMTLPPNDWANSPLLIHRLLAQAQEALLC
jgi:hypothetical protein